MIRHEWFNQIFFIEKTLSVFVFIYALLYARIPFLTGKMKEKEKTIIMITRIESRYSMTRYETKKALREKPKKK